MVAQNNIFGNWGDFVFTARISPKYGTFSRQKKWNYVQHNVLSGLPKVEPVGRDLTTINFTMNVKNFVFLQFSQTFLERAVATTGIISSGTTTEYYGMYDDIRTVIANLENLAKTQKPQPFYEGEIYKGQFILTDFTEDILHYQDGFEKVDDISLSFLEYN